MHPKVLPWTLARAVSLVHTLRRRIKETTFMDVTTVVAKTESEEIHEQRDIDDRFQK